MAEWLGNGLQNRLQQFDSAWYLKKREVSDDFSFFLRYRLPPVSPRGGISSFRSASVRCGSRVYWMSVSREVEHINVPSEAKSVLNPCCGRVVEHANASQKCLQQGVVCLISLLIEIPGRCRYERMKYQPGRIAYLHRELSGTCPVDICGEQQRWIAPVLPLFAVRIHGFHRASDDACYLLCIVRHD